MRFKTTAKTVRETRAILGLTQKELARKLGVHLQVVSNIERGVAGIPRARAHDFAKVLGITVKRVAKDAAEDFFRDYILGSK